MEPPMEPPDGLFVQLVSSTSSIIANEVDICLLNPYWLLYNIWTLHPCMQ